MKKMVWMSLLVLSVAAFAQNEAPAVQDHQSAAGVAERQMQPTYSDIYCAGFVSKENIPTTNHVVAGYRTPWETKFAGKGDIVYITGSGLAVGNRYSVIRKMVDPNREEMFKGEMRLLHQSGEEYADLGQVEIIQVEKEVAAAKIDHSCTAMTPGDILVPFQERPRVQYQPRTEEFPLFAPYSGTGGRIIGAKEFDRLLGIGQKVYVNIGSSKGVKPGDYLRITRNYDPAEMSTIDALTLKPPKYEETAKDPAKVTDSDLKKLPYRGVGEMIVLSVTPETATGMITLALEDVQVGDVVEVPTKR